MATARTDDLCPVALNVNDLKGPKAPRRKRRREHQLCFENNPSVTLIVLGSGLILLGVIDIVFGTLCASAGVRYGVTGDTLIKPWREFPLGGVSIICGAMSIHLSRRKTCRTAIVSMLLSVVCAAWSAVVAFLYCFDAAEKSGNYNSWRAEVAAASSSNGLFLEYRKSKMNQALRDMSYFSSAVAFAILTCLLACFNSAMSGFVMGSLRVDQTGSWCYRRQRNVIASMSKVYIKYKSRVALASGVLQIVCGCSVALGLGLALATEHNPTWAFYVITHGVIFIVSGIVGAISSRSKARPIVMAAMISSLVAAVAAVDMICSDVSFLIIANTNSSSGRSKIEKGSFTMKLFTVHGLDLFINILEVTAAIVLSGIGCHVTCDVAARADDTRCLVSYVEIGQADRRTRRRDIPDYNMNEERDESSSVQIPDILNGTDGTEDDIFRRERPTYMSEALTRS